MNAKIETVKRNFVKEEQAKTHWSQSGDNIRNGEEIVSNDLVYEKDGTFTVETVIRKEVA